MEITAACYTPKSFLPSVPIGYGAYDPWWITPGESVITSWEPRLRAKTIIKRVNQCQKDAKHVHLYGNGCAINPNMWRSYRKSWNSKPRQPDLRAHTLTLFLYRALKYLSLSAHRIGFAIARRLAQDGAHVVVSSRKQQNVDRAVATLKGEGLSVTGTVCHVGKAEDRERLVATVSSKHTGPEP